MTRRGAAGCFVFIMLVRPVVQNIGKIYIDDSKYNSLPLAFNIEDHSITNFFICI
ncbi:hypothetical protein HanHA300_Chr04g0129081 [Helianthus annuus]|nr:hypothetical protein HanHA300_Chr04g0129081 [Helianthus annuus]KAJ0596382.1 hypothetical protein HanHA89_Chr04g0142131 [Helianthus annuus]